MRNLVWLSSCLGFLLLVCIIGHGVEGGSKRKYAPTYCLRLKFNCASKDKKKHVCCMFPLPVTDTGAGSVSVADTLESSAAAAVGVKRIRPLRLPSRDETSSDLKSKANPFFLPPIEFLHHSVVVPFYKIG